MTNQDKIDFIRGYIELGKSRASIQAGLKMKFGSGVNNTVIRDIRAEEPKKKDTDLIPKIPKKIPEKKKRNTGSTSITKAELWEAIKSDEDLKGLKTWFTIKPNRPNRTRKGFGDLVIVINELIKKKINEKKKDGKN